MRGRGGCVFAGRTQCAGRESSLKRQWMVDSGQWIQTESDYQSITTALPNAFESITIRSRKLLRIKQLPINSWCSIGCGDKVRGAMILKKRGGGRGLTR